MLVYDDQRMGCHMGLTCVMEKFGLVCVSTTGTANKAYDEELLQKIVKDFGRVHITVDGNSTKDILFAKVDQMIALFERGIPVRASGEPARRRMVHRTPTSASTDTYRTLAYVHKHLFWLISVSEQAKSCRIDWRAMSLRDMAQLVPDEPEELQRIGWEVLVTAVT